MDIWKSLVDKLAPLIIAFAAGEMATELSALFAGFIGRAKRVQSIAKILWHSWFLFITTRIRQRLLALSIIPIVLSMVVLALAKRWCGGSFPVPWEIYLWPIAALLYVMYGLFRTWRDMPKATVPTDLLDGRVGTPESYSRYTPDQQEREFEHVGMRPRALINVELSGARVDLATARAAGNADEITRLEALEKRLTEELAARTAFERRLQSRPATQPLMSDAEFARALDPYRPLDRSPLPHLFAMAYELLIVAFLLLGADLTLGGFAFQSGGVNLTFPVLIGVCGFAVFILWAVAFWLAVIVPSEGLETAATTPAKPITAVYHLVVQILPFIDDKNVADRAGSYTGATFTKVRDHLKSFGTYFRSKMGVVYTIGLVLPHPFVALCGLLFAIVTGVTRTNKEVEGLDTKAERQADAVLLHKGFGWALIIVLTLIFVLTFGRTLVADLLMWIVLKVNSVLHPIALERPSEALRSSDYALAWVGYVLKAVVMLAVAAVLMNVGMDWTKAKTAYKPKFGAAMAAFGAIIFANVFFSVPHLTESSTIQSIRTALMCPVPPENSVNVATTASPPVVSPAPVPAPAPAPPPTPAFVPAPAPTQPLAPNEVRRSRRRHESPVVYVVGAPVESLGCPEADRLPLCDEGTYRVEDFPRLRRSCLCR